MFEYVSGALFAGALVAFWSTKRRWHYLNRQFRGVTVDQLGSLKLGTPVKIVGKVKSVLANTLQLSDGLGDGLVQFDCPVEADTGDKLEVQGWVERSGRARCVRVGQVRNASMLEKHRALGQYSYVSPKLDPGMGKRVWGTLVIALALLAGAAYALYVSGIVKVVI